MSKARFTVGQTVSVKDGDEDVKVIVKRINVSRKGNVYDVEGLDGEIAGIPANDLMALKNGKPVAAKDVDAEEPEETEKE